MQDDVDTSNHNCHHCGYNKPTTYRVNPYAASIHGNFNSYWLCDECIEQLEYERDSY